MHLGPKFGEFSEYFPEKVQIQSIFGPFSIKVQNSDHFRTTFQKSPNSDQKSDFRTWWGLCSAFSRWLWIFCGLFGLPVAIKNISPKLPIFMWHQNLAKPVLYLSADYDSQLAQGKFQQFQINLIKCPNNTNLQVLSNYFFYN